MKVTVILCTYNRCESLRVALESVARSLVPASIEWEVLVVDNNSNDRTKQVFDEFNSKFPARFRYLFEAKPGKSNALNSAIRVSNCDVVAFMDDDVIVDSAWLTRLTSALMDSSYSGVGGKILPQWKTTPPRWLPVKERYGLAPLVMFDLGDAGGPLDEPPYGTNMAFRRGAFDRYGEFRTDLGPRPGSEIRNEDTEYGRRLLEAGEHFYYEPSAVVYHEVPEKRLKKQFFLKWNFDKARADIREVGLPQGARWTIAGVPLYLFRRLVVWFGKWMCGVDPSVRFARKIKVWSVVGTMQECYNLSRQSRYEQAETYNASTSVKP